jgi:hypothetical protein
MFHNLVVIGIQFSDDALLEPGTRGLWVWWMKATSGALRAQWAHQAQPMVSGFV